MKIKGLTLEIIKTEAEKLGFRLDNVRSAGNYTFFVLRMAQGTPQRCYSYSPNANGLRCTRKRDHEGRCWHRDDQLKIHDSWAHPGTHHPDMRFRKRGIQHEMYGRGPSYGTAVCFHGFREFMRACFRRNKDTIIRTAKAAYLGLEDFNEKFPKVGRTNVGSQCAPVAYEDCCDCDPADDHEIQFGTLNPPATPGGKAELTNVRMIKQSDIKRCKFFILSAEHYRADGSCKCDDPEHRKMMIKEWEYTKASFKGIPLRKEG